MDMMVEVLASQLNCQITCVMRAEDALDVEMLEPHDLVIAALDAPEACEDRAVATIDDSSASDLITALASLSRRPVILTCYDLHAPTALCALRCGVHDILIKPFPLLKLLQSARAALEGFTMQREHVRRYAQMRGLVRRLLRERRELRRRMDLVCKDLVGAHRRLVRRVLQVEERLVQE